MTSPDPSSSLGSTALELDVDDAAARRRFLAAFNAAWPDFATSEQEFLHELRTQGAARRWILEGPDGAGDIGAVWVERSPWNDEAAPPIAMIAVSRAHAREDVYLAALRLCSDFARGEGFTELRVLVWSDERVARDALAAIPGWREVEEDVDVGLDVTEAIARGLPDAELPPGTALTDLAQRPELAASAHACLVAAVLDIPGDEPTRIPPLEEWLDILAGPAMRPEACLLAVEAASDEVVGYAALEYAELLDATTWHGFTAVRPDHRRRGIATALKVAVIRFAYESGVRRLNTENEERNAPMRAINARLGYGPVAVRYVARGPIVDA